MAGKEGRLEGQMVDQKENLPLGEKEGRLEGQMVDQKVDQKGYLPLEGKEDRLAEHRGHFQ
jgi:hypothetical protein